VSVALAAVAGALAGAAGTALLADALRATRRVRRDGAGALPAVAVAAASRAGARLFAAARPGSPRTRNAAERLAAAGRPADIGAREWVALKWCAAVAMGLCGAAAAGSLPGRLPLAALAAAPAAGFVAPEFWLARVTARRLRAAGRELAPMLDLLQVTVEAGAAPAAALGAVGARFTGPLAAEWRAAATAIALGTPHDRALGALTARLPAPRIRAFAECMIRARRRGLPLGELVARQAAAARHEEQIRIREQAARAGPKIQLVVAFVLVPAVMLIVAAALVAELTAPGTGLTY
jgi:tight adherence protein C